MNLKEYDEKCVKIITDFDEIFEGICIYNDSEYNESEYGKCEDSLQILSFMFYESIISGIESLEDRKTKYGKFSSAYGNIEKLIVEDGIDSIKDAIEYEEDEHTYRLLVCIKDYIDEFNKDELIELLKFVIRFNENEKIIELAKSILNSL